MEGVAAVLCVVGGDVVYRNSPAARRRLSYGQQGPAAAVATAADAAARATAAGCLPAFAVAAATATAKQRRLWVVVVLPAARCAFEVALHVRVHVHRVDEVAALATVAHAVEVVVCAVRERRGVLALGGTRQTRARGPQAAHVGLRPPSDQNTLRRNESGRLLIVRRPHRQHISSRQPWIHTQALVPPDVVHMDRVGLQLREVAVRMHKLTVAAHRTALRVVGTVVATQHEARDVQPSRRQVHHRARRHIVDELKVRIEDLDDVYIRGIQLLLLHRRRRRRRLGAALRMGVKLRRIHHSGSCVRAWVHKRLDAGSGYADRRQAMPSWRRTKKKRAERKKKTGESTNDQKKKRRKENRSKLKEATRSLKKNKKKKQ